MARTHTEIPGGLAEYFALSRCGSQPRSANCAKNPRLMRKHPCRRRLSRASCCICWRAWLVPARRLRSGAFMGYSSAWVALALPPGGKVILRRGELIAVDNVPWHGKVSDMDNHDPDTEALRAFNQKVYADDRVMLRLVAASTGGFGIRTELLSACG